jgi:U3 small nucleolar ribonucleoprotein protein IMP4
MSRAGQHGELMHKRDVRLRREYLYRKSLESKEQALAENKKKLKAAIAAGKSIPTELRKDEKRLRHEVELEDANTALVATHEDDEYELSFVQRIFVTV